MWTYSPAIVGVIVTGAGQAVVDELEDDGAPVNRACLLVPGDIAWDECDCGQLAQTVTAVTPSNTFPQPAADLANTPCGPNQVLINVTLSLVRCVVGPNDSGHPPGCDSLLSDALRLERDRFIVRTALRCHLKPLFDQMLISGFTIGAATSVGPNGLCAGIEIPYTVGIANAGCC